MNAEGCVQSIPKVHVFVWPPVGINALRPGELAAVVHSRSSRSKDGGSFANEVRSPASCGDFVVFRGSAEQARCLRIETHRFEYQCGETAVVVLAGCLLKLRESRGAPKKLLHGLRRDHRSLGQSLNDEADEVGTDGGVIHTGGASLLQYKAAAKHVVAQRLAASRCGEDVDMLPKQRGVDIDLGTKCRVIRLIRELELE
jgi:hypothetical protein